MFLPKGRIGLDVFEEIFSFVKIILAPKIGFGGSLEDFNFWVFPEFGQVWILGIGCDYRNGFPLFGQFQNQAGLEKHPRREAVGDDVTYIGSNAIQNEFILG